MNLELAVDIMRNLLQTGLILAIPILGTATVVGLLVSFVQSITSLQEQTLTFVPKLVCVSLAILISSNFILRTLMDFCISMFSIQVFYVSISQLTQVVYLNSQPAPHRVVSFVRILMKVQLGEIKVIIAPIALIGTNIMIH